MSSGDRVAAGLQAVARGQVQPLKALFDGFDLLPSPSFLDAIGDISADGCLPSLGDSAATTYQMASDSLSPAGVHEGSVLDKEELAAIMQYTSETPVLYKVMNDKCYDPNRRVMKPFLRYMWLLMNALRALEPFSEQMVFRGVKRDLRADYPEGRVVTWHGFASCTKRISVLSNPDFLGASGPRTQFIIQLTQGQARDITPYSFFEEGEVMLQPGCRFVVKDVLPLGAGLTQIQLVEMPSTMWLLDISRSTSAGHGGTRTMSGSTPVAERAFDLYLRGRVQEAVGVLCIAPDDVDARSILGRFYVEGKGVPKDVARGLPMLLEGAQQGSPWAQYSLGTCYLGGMGVEKDIRRAVELFTLAAAQHNAPGQFKLGSLYEDGVGVKKDIQRAIELYTLAADQGNTSAQFNLARCHEIGIGVAKDAKRAVQLYRLAADQGHARAQNNLACCYEHGDGVEQDIQKAMELYQLAAAQGHTLAQSNLRSLQGGCRLQ